MSFDFLMVGLGNPGSEYAHHRHNIGFMAADALAQRWQAKAWQKKYQGLITDIILPTADGPQRVLLLKPQTFMNLSGQSVQAAAAFYKTPVEKIFVLHDEIELIPARVRIKQGGGHAGHNGLKSVDACVG
ncbi:MAG: aminoacyl-tRNA hydrolase, partial [Alphaproteobacteria bacterium]|nr:aminoacyl-tRNA hydrolase [Alphaproteobacteria bacterium]